MSQKKFWVAGRMLEELVFQKIKLFLGHDNDNYHHIYLDRPDVYKGNKWHKKKRIEVDNMFYFRGKIYIIQCKRRKGRVDQFWTPSTNSKDLWFNGKKCTGLYLDNLWKAKTYLVYNKLYAFHDKPLHIKTILLMDSKIKAGENYTNSIQVRDTSVITYNYFLKWLKFLRYPSNPI